MLLLSWVAAVVACLGYGVSTVLQSVAASRVDPEAGVGGLGRIVRQLPYLAGLGLDGLAFLANVVALQDLPLFVVQSVVAGSVGVTAVLASLRGDRLSPRDWLALAVLGVGLLLLSVTAVPGSAARLSLAADLVILAAAAVPLVLGLVGLRLRGRASPLVLSVAAGLGFTGVAVAARGMDADGWGWGLLTDPLLYAILLHGVLAMALFTLALQRGRVTTVTAVTFVIEVVAPSLLGIVLFAATVQPGFELVAGAGFVLALGGTVWLSRFGD